MGIILVYELNFLFYAITVSFISNVSAITFVIVVIFAFLLLITIKFGNIFQYTRKQPS